MGEKGKGQRMVREGEVSESRKDHGRRMAGVRERPGRERKRMWKEEWGSTGEYTYCSTVRNETKKNSDFP